MKSREERRKAILNYSDMPEANMLHQVQMYLHQDGIINTVAYLQNKTGGKKVLKLLEECLEVNLEPISLKKDTGKISNSAYASIELQALKVVTEAILFAEAGVLEKAIEETSSEKPMKKEKYKEFIPPGEKGNYGQCDRWKRFKDGYKERSYKKKNEVTNKENITSIYEQLGKRTDLIIQMFRARGYSEVLNKDGKEIYVRSRRNSRLIVGLGEPSVKETGLCVDFLYGMPMLPGTAIKGVFRHFCEDKLEAGTPERERIENWFGNEKHAGELIFLDSIPEKYSIVEDVISNHYQNYYQGENNYPTEEEPNLVSYKSVRVDKMRIVILKKTDLTRDENKQVYNLFHECLKECSFGARGSVGYGYLQEERKECDENF